MEMVIDQAARVLALALLPPDPIMPGRVEVLLVDGNAKTRSLPGQH